CAKVQVALGANKIIRGDGYGVSTGCLCECRKGGGRQQQAKVCVRKLFTGRLSSLRLAASRSSRTTAFPDHRSGTELRIRPQAWSGPSSAPCPPVPWEQTRCPPNRQRFFAGRAQRRAARSRQVSDERMGHAIVDGRRPVQPDRRVRRYGKPVGASAVE